MMDSNQDLLQIAQVLLDYYSFDIGQSTANQLIQQWARTYPPEWVRPAILEALYQGRYKGISIDQILALWGRLGYLSCHFSHEFEQLICQPLLDQAQALPSVADGSDSDLVWQGAHGNSDLIVSGLGTEPDAQDSKSPDLESQGLESQNFKSQNPQFVMLLRTRAPGRSGQSSSAFPSRGPNPDIASVRSSMVSRMVSRNDAAGPKPVRVFQPQGTLDLNIVQLVDNNLDLSRKTPIHQFIPLGGPPEFHAKLRAVADCQLMIPAS